MLQFNYLLLIYDNPVVRLTGIELRNGVHISLLKLLVYDLTTDTQFVTCRIYF
jgi:hypothetical protein